MPLSWNEIRDRALAFSRDWAGEKSERAEAQTFWNGFFNVFGIERRRVAVFEKQVKLSRVGEKVKNGRIDAFWKGMLLVEHKSAGADLERAYEQATDYFDGLPERDLPRYIVVSDFAQFRLYDLETGGDWKFALKEFPKHIKRFGFMAGYRTQEVREQDPVNVEAAERMGKLHDLLKASGYTGHALEVLLVRVLFCLFADDTGIFNRQSFREYIEEKTAPDGSDLGLHFAQIFQVLNTPPERRQRNLDDALAAFQYVNGRLFEEQLPLASFDAKMRATLLDCAALDWSAVSPAVFGAMFQSVMDDKARRNLGAHYTSETNILKLIKPLFLDDLRAEFSRIKNNVKRLFEFHKRLRTLVFFDPACGCGNFLVIAYRELRLLELDILRTVLAMEKGQQHLNVFNLVQVNVDQFHGIEIEEFPAQIAQVALWLVDHQMNQLVSSEFGHYYARLPLVTSPHIVHGNALQLDWEQVVPKERLPYLFGNPPFVGKQYQTDEQKADLGAVFAGMDGAGVLDFVAAWYVRATQYMAGTRIKAAFVSTNSLTQGEQVGVLWPELFRRGLRIHFAHRTFQWTNEARGVAAVHCVIIGFGFFESDRHTLFDYADIKGEPQAREVSTINAYLVEAPTVFLQKIRQPICNWAPPIAFGSMPNDGGHLLLSPEEKKELLQKEPEAKPYLRRLMGSEEFINGIERWCLWLADTGPDQLRRLPLVMERVEKVREARAASKRETTRELARFPTRFGEMRQPQGRYVAIPEVSSENRLYIPIAFLEPSVVATNKLYTIDGGTLFHFGILQSAMHLAWTRAVCGRLKSDIQYSAGIVYNNFPWPADVQAKQVTTIEAAAKAVLDTRAKYANASLADLYDALAMPEDLTKAHAALDRAVDAAYGQKGFSSDTDRVAFLLKLYSEYTSLPLEPTATRVRGRRARA
jgi:hypothetical protein